MNHSNKGALGLPCACLTTRMTGEPYSGNLYLRFDEDLGRKTPEITLLVANCRSMERRIKKLNHGKHGLHGRELNRRCFFHAETRRGGAMSSVPSAAL